MSRRYRSVTRRRGISRRAPLLTRHGDPQLLLWVDGVAVAVVAEVDADPVDLAGEAAGPGRVVRGDGGPGLVADVGRLVGRDDHGLSRLDAAPPDRPVVVEQGDVTTLGQAAAVIRELHPDLDMTARHRFVGNRGELVDAEDVVDELGRPVLCVERPAAEPTTLGDEH